MRARVGKAETVTRVSVRLPERLRRDIAGVAAAGDRSFNYEIVVRLQASIELDKILDAKTTGEALEILQKLKLRMRDLRLATEAH
jgi:Arc-like DNA binding domain